MQKLTQIIKTAYSRKAMDCQNVMLLTLVLLPILSFTFYSNPVVLGQEKQQNYASNDILICQITEYIESPIGANIDQISNICNYQKSIGYNQSLAELCFILSGNNVGIINAFCDKAILNRVSIPSPQSPSTSTLAAATVNETSTPSPQSPSTSTSAAVNETNETLNSQNTTDNGLRVTIFDGVSNFFSDIFNP